MTENEDLKSKVARWLLIALTLSLVCGCQSYSTAEKMKYFEDARQILAVHREIVDLDLGGVGTQVKLKEPSEKLKTRLQDFSKTYQGSPLDEEFELLDKLHQLRVVGTEYFLYAERADIRAMSDSGTSKFETTAEEDARTLVKTKKAYKDLVISLEGFLKEQPTS